MGHVCVLQQSLHLVGYALAWVGAVWLLNSFDHLDGLAILHDHALGLCASFHHTLWRGLECGNHPVSDHALKLGVESGLNEVGALWRCHGQGYT